MASVTGFTVVVAPVRPGAEPAAARALPHHPGRHRRRDAAAVAGRAARGVSAARARQGHGLLGPRHRRRADPRAGARRLADRHLQLALGVLHQPAGRHRVARDDEALHLRSAVPAARDASASTTGASACWRCGSARCSSCSTWASSATGSRRRSSRRWSSRRGVRRGRVPRARVDGGGAGRRPARVQDPHLRHRRVPDDDARLRALSLVFDIWVVEPKRFCASVADA